MKNNPVIVLGLTLSVSGFQSSLANDGYAVFDQASSQVTVPCVSHKGTEYEAVFRYGGPSSLVVQSLTPIGAHISGCALHEPIENNVYIPVVTVGDRRYWAVITKTADSPLTFAVSEMGRYMKTDPNALTGEDSGCLANIETLTTGELDSSQYQAAFTAANGSPGNSYCQAALAHAYTRGWGVERDYDRALEQAKASAEQGNPHGQAILGKLYEEGFASGRKVGHAYIWSYLSADQGNAQGQAQFGNLHHAHGNVLWMESNSQEAEKWIQQAADQGNLDAYVSVGYLQQDDSQALRWFMEAADGGNVYGQNAVGSAYRKGEGVSEDLGQAEQWLAKAAGQGLPIGMKNLAYHYLMTDDHQQAIDWFTDCHESGDSLGECAAYVGSIYYGSYGSEGGVAQNYSAALSWYQRTPAGYSHAARMYQDGLGVDRDPDQAVHWYEKAAEAGDYSAYQLLGTIYEFGVYGTDFQTDETLACQYYKLYKDGMWRFAGDYMDSAINRVCQ